MTLIVRFKNYVYKGAIKLETEEATINYAATLVSVTNNLARDTKITNKILMRVLDIFAGIVGCLCLIPLTIIVLINNIKNKDFGPIFFVQERIGKDGRLFKMYKYRTMVVGADQKLDEYLKENENARKEYTKYKKLRNDPRITKFGEFLRKTSLDEFPQFINILKGEMSLVGPRPYLKREKEDMGAYYSWIIKNKPGLTGLWQISGRSEVAFDDRLDLDLKYNYIKSLKSDIKILLITALITLKRKGAM